MNLTQKEKEGLQDALTHENICVTKYKNYADQLKDPQLKSLFLDLYKKEEQHRQTITQLLQQGGF